MKVLLILSLLLFPTFRCVAESSPKEKIMQEIIELFEMDKTMAEAKSAASTQARAAGQQMFDRLRVEMPDQPDAFWEKITEAAHRMMSRIDQSWSVDEAIGIWATEFSAELSAEELQQILDACKTPEGQKQIAASKRASKAFQAYMIQKNKDVVEAAINDYIAELQRILASETSASG